jgi:hypothetical protein
MQWIANIIFYIGICTLISILFLNEPIEVFKEGKLQWGVKLTALSFVCIFLTLPWLVLIKSIRIFKKC